MRFILTMLCLGSAVWAQYSIRFDGAKAEASAGFNAAPGNVGALRLEFRIHDFSQQAPNGAVVLTACSQFLWMFPNGTLRLTDWASGGDSHVHDIKDRNDVIIRVQHLVDQGVTLFEMWNANGEKYSVKKLAGRKVPFKCEADVLLGSNGSPGSNFAGSLAYFRWFNTVVPEGALPTFSPEGAVLAYEFEQNGDPEAGNAKKLKTTGTQYVKTPSYGPSISLLTAEQTIDLNGSVELSAAQLSPIAGWEWVQVSGPSQMTITNANTPNATVSGATEPGTYVFQVTASDASGLTASRTVRLGVVLNDERGVVRVADENVSFVLGPLLRKGKGPWPFYEKIRNEMGVKWGESYTPAPGEKDVRAGRVSLTRNSRTIRGTGTTFLKDFTEPPAYGTGTVSVVTGGTEARGTGTQFLQTFLNDIKTGAGLAKLDSGANFVEGQGTKFTEMFGPNDYILLTVPGGGFLLPEERAFRIAKVLDDRTLELQRVWQGNSISAGSFRSAKSANKLFVFEEPGGRVRTMDATPQTNTVMSLPAVYDGPSGTGLKYGTTVRSEYDHIVVHYPVPEPGQQGRYALYFVSVVSDTELTLSLPYGGPTIESSPYGRATSNEILYWIDGINYYDSVLVHYQNYYRTGIDTYLKYARTLADDWYQGLDGGRDPSDSPMPPRMIGLAGLILRALDGRPDMWPMIRRATKYNYNLWIGLRRDYPGLYYGVRDGGFALYFTALMGKVDPDPASRDEFLRLAQDGSVNLYARLQKPDGSWRWGDDLWKGNGEQPFHVGLLLEGMIATHRLTRDPVILDSILKSVDHLIAIQQPAPCRSTVYAIYNDDGPWGAFCLTPGHRPPSRDEIMDSRAGNNTIMHAVGYAYAMTGQEKYKQAGDDMFSATFGNLQGPGADEYWGRADTTAKQYGQSFRTSDSYLVYRLSPQGAAPPDF